MGDDVNRPRFKEIRVIEENNLAVLQAYVTFQRINPRGELVESMKNRTTLVLIREGDAWKIWHDHTSIPVEMVSFKGMLAKE
jgi:ketosteroid isomerase-like protein